MWRKCNRIQTTFQGEARFDSSDAMDIILFHTNSLDRKEGWRHKCEIYSYSFTSNGNAKTKIAGISTIKHRAASLMLHVQSIYLWAASHALATRGGGGGAIPDRDIDILTRVSLRCQGSDRVSRQGPLSPPPSLQPCPPHLRVSSTLRRMKSIC